VERRVPRIAELATLLALAACGRVEQGPLVHAGGGQAAGEPGLARLAAELEPEVARLRAELEAERAARAALEDGSAHRRLEAEVARLRSELADSEDRRIAREKEWLAYTRAVSALELESLPDDLEFVPDLPSEPEPEAGPGDEDLARIEREGAIHRTLRALLAVEEVRGLDLLETGALGDGWVGPVVFRLLDASGRLAGSIWAERLRLEGSRAARTLTLVLEDGYETRGGVRTDFALRKPGEPTQRRIVLPQVDPIDWAGALPELFGGLRLDEPVDDGRWNHSLVRGTLNELLRRHAAGGWYRLKAFDGVMNGVFRQVHVEHLDGDGRIERHLFADRMTIEKRERGVMLLLEDGAQVRGEEKAAFLEGRFPIYLPLARVEDWEQAGIPGLSEPASTGG